MTFKEIDWKILRMPLAVLIVCGVTVVLLVMLSHTFVARASAEFRKVDSQFRSIRSQYRGVDEEKAIIAEYQPRYDRLVLEGVVGRERRLDWVDALRGAARELKLPSLRYQLDTQKAYDSGYSSFGTQSTAYTSLMTLDVGLLHEEDLVRLFDALEKRAPGLFRVSSCSISLAPDAIHTEPTVANLNATCSLDWLTVRPRDAATNAPLGG